MRESRDAQASIFEHYLTHEYRVNADYIVEVSLDYYIEPAV